MLEVLIQMAALIVCGVVWRLVSPGGLNAAMTRQALTGLVYYLFLPALVLLVLWEAPIGIDTVKIALAAAAGIIGALILMRWSCHFCKMPPAATGAILLAAAFPNATYLGLPVLEASLGPESRSIAIQYDLFACTPILLTLGITISAIYGDTEKKENPILSLAKVPALWAAFAAVILNTLNIPFPDALSDWLKMLANGVAPLMLISLGLSLTFSRDQFSLMRSIAPAVLVQLMIMPLIVWLVAATSGLEGMTLQAVVLEAAMPSMLLGVVLCDKYKLDTALYAATVTVTTALSFITLSLWSGWLGI